MKKKTPKVSPTKGMAVDAWIEQQVDPKHRELVKDLLGLARKAAPKATLSIKWNQPVLDCGGPLVFVRAAKAHVTIGFWRGSELRAPAGVLEGAGDRMRHIKIAATDELDDKLVMDLVKQAVKLNAAKGDPTRR
jgi:hypothetical protein